MGQTTFIRAQSGIVDSSKIVGCKVENAQGENLGKIESLMLDLQGGRIAYAVLSFGGFLGMGQSYHPLPWKALTYDTGKGGYVVDLDKDRLQNAPSYAASETPDWSDPSYGRRIDDYYGSTGM
jgi:hypothetical protein